jgi:DNA damage-binding protein 1
MATRDLEGAKQAYALADMESSKAAHDSVSVKSNEKHLEISFCGLFDGDHLKSIVYGGLDGIITTFAVVAGASGGGLGTNVILILGFSNIFADALSMGMGDALSTKAENEHILNERRREAWELENYKDGEVKEMVDIYEEKGMKRMHAEVMLRIMAKYHDIFLDNMMLHELGMQVPDEDENPWKAGLVTFCSFVFFGLFPLLGYCIFAQYNLDLVTLFSISCVLSAIMLFVLGVCKSRFTGQKWWASG